MRKTHDWGRGLDHKLTAMSRAVVRYVRGDLGAFEIVGVGTIGTDGAGELGGPLEILGPASATSMRAACRRWRHEYREKDWFCSIWVTETSAADFDGDYSPSSPVGFFIDEQGICVTVEHFAARDAIDEHFIRTILDPLLVRTRCTDLEIEVEGTPRYAYWTVSFRPPSRGRTLQDLYRLGSNVEALLDAIKPTGLTRATTADLVRAGRADLLVGLEEMEWLEVKSAPYNLAADAGRIELAQDVARFANADGGLLILGMKTKRCEDGERISTVRPIPRDLVAASRHRAVIDGRLFPPVEGLSIEIVPQADGVLVLIAVPSQPDELKPFLVHGAIVAGRVEGSFFSIVTRRGDATVVTSAPAIHSMISAGRAVLRGHIPPACETTAPGD